jgi:hypothetical protein
MPPVRPTERQQQAQIVALLTSLGGKVWTLGTTRKRRDHHGTMQSPGLPDLIAFIPTKHQTEARHWEFLVVEVKAKGGRLRPEQQTFRDLCHAAGIPHIVGDLDAVFAWLLDKGYLRREQINHART